MRGLSFRRKGKGRIMNTKLQILEGGDYVTHRKLSRQALKGVDRKKQRNVMQMIDGSEFVTITRVFFGWSVRTPSGETHVSAIDLPELQTKRLDEFVNGRSVAGLIVDRAKCAVA
mgnify:CR=1 FL=1